MNLQRPFVTMCAVHSTSTGEEYARQRIPWEYDGNELKCNISCICTVNNIVYFIFFRLYVKIYGPDISHLPACLCPCLFHIADDLFFFYLFSLVLNYCLYLYLFFHCSLFCCLLIFSLFWSCRSGRRLFLLRRFLCFFLCGSFCRLFFCCLYFCCLYLDRKSVV